MAKPKEPKFPLLDRKAILDAFRYLVEAGNASCSKAADLLARRGMITPRTGLPPTRQAVHYALKDIPEGRELLNYANQKRRKGQRLK